MPRNLLSAQPGGRWRRILRGTGAFASLLGAAPSTDVGNFYLMGAAAMGNALLCLTRNETLLNRLCDVAFAGEPWQAIHCIEAIRPHLADGPPRAVIVHLSSDFFNGRPAQDTLRGLRELVGPSPIGAIVDRSCPPHVERIAADVLDVCVPDNGDLSRIVQWVRCVTNPVFQLCGFRRDLPFKAIFGRSRSLITFTPDMFQMLDELSVAAAHDVTVLLIGETGCGKTHLAWLIHELSSRRNERMCTVACGALAPELIESELFGHVRGSFNGADRNRQGKFEAAGKGTLLLDEIEVLPREQQAKLLRVIETGEYEPVGTNETFRSAARIIVASKLDLEELISSGTMRMDLYYRLNVLKFHLLPLRDRPWDVEFLIRHFAHTHSREHGIELNTIDPEFIDTLRSHAWPGNIRELENAMRRAVLYCRGGALTANDVPTAIRTAESKIAGRGRNGVTRGLTLEARVDQMQRRTIEEALRRNNHRRNVTAQELGISRVTLYNKMKKFGLLRKGPRRSLPAAAGVRSPRQPR